MKIRILTRKGSQEVEVLDTPIFICIEDKKYVISEGGSLRRVWGKLKKDLIEIVGEQRHGNNDP